MTGELRKCIRRMFSPIIMFKGYEDLVVEEMKIKITIERLKDHFPIQPQIMRL